MDSKKNVERLIFLGIIVVKKIKKYNYIRFATREEIDANMPLTITPEPDTMVYMLKKGLKIKEVQVEMKEREFGKSYLTPIKSMKYMVNMIFSIVFIRAITRKK